MLVLHNFILMAWSRAGTKVSFKLQRRRCRCLVSYRSRLDMGQDGVTLQEIPSQRSSTEQNFLSLGVVGTERDTKESKEGSAADT